MAKGDEGGKKHELVEKQKEERERRAKEECLWIHLLQLIW